MFDNHHEWMGRDHGRGFGPHWGHGRGFPWGRGFEGPWERGHGFGVPQRGPGPEEGSFGSADAGDGGMFGGRDWRGGGRGDRPGFGFGRGPGRSERVLEQGDLRWLVLDLIAVQPRHGYEIIKAIEDMMSGHYTPSPGVIYPTLTYLEETGLIASEAQATKKLYSITGEGQAALEANAAALQAVRARIEEAHARFGNAPAPELTRAMGNLRAAIQIRLSRGALSPEALAAVTAALDRAASEIERS